MALDNILLIPGLDWTPRNLFRPGDNGLWQDMSNFGTLRQLSTGSTLVSSVGDPIGYIADSGPRGHLTTQTTNGKRPILSRSPEGGVRNLLQRTEEFDNAYWTKANSTVVANVAANPINGTLDADRMTTSASFGEVRATAFTYPSTGTYTLKVYAKSETLPQLILRLDRTTNTANVTLTFATETVTTSGANIISGSATSVGDGWYLIKATANVVDAAFVVGYTGGSVTGSVLLWGAQIEKNATDTPYQKVTTRYDITEAGKRDCWAYGTDGIDDAMSTPSSVDMSGSDEMTVCVGVRKLSDASAGYFCEFSETSSVNNGTFYLLHSALGLANYQTRSRGDLSTLATVSAYVAPSSNILLLEGKISTDVNRLTIDGGTTVANTGDQGAGNFGNYRLFFGARNETSSFCNALIYQAIIINRLLSDYEKTKLQQFVARKMGITL